MFKLAASELKYHPARFVATLVAVAISVGFMVAASGITATMQEGMAQKQTVNISHADISIKVSENEPYPAEKLQRTLSAIPGVADCAQLRAYFDTTNFGDRSEFISYYALPPTQFRWASLLEGAWPQTDDEIAIGQSAMKLFQAKLGDSLRITSMDKSLRVVGITNDSAGVYAHTGYLAPGAYTKLFLDNESAYGQWLLRVDSTADLASVTKAVNTAVNTSDITGEVASKADALKAAREGFLRDLQIWKWVMWAFGGIAMVVGMITISNTFSILLAGRQRQIGLLRAVGASGRQVRNSVFIEALLLGLVGALLGVGLGVIVTVIGTAVIDMLKYGLQFPLAETIAIAALGTLITLVAALLPTLRSTRAAPLDALRPASARTEQRAGIVRGIVCGLLALSGLAIITAGLQGSKNVLLYSIAGAGLFSIGVLFGASLFVPLLLRLAGMVVSRLGPTPRLAAKNVIRNPRRSSATATALMLAMGLIVTLQVGSASLRQTVEDRMASSYPIDIAIDTSWSGDSLRSIPDKVVDQVTHASGVTAWVKLPGTRWTTESESEDESGWRYLVLGYDPAIAKVATIAPTALADDVALVSSLSTQIGKDGTIKLNGYSFKAEKTKLLDSNFVMVSPKMLAKIGPTVPAAALWLAVPDRSLAASAYADINSAVSGNSDLRVTGSVIGTAGLEKVIFLVMAVVSALLGIAVLIALVGVSNTLTLSVLERKRESALMRAIGLQKSSLRAMLLIEALLLAGVGAVVGLAAGLFFGWVGGKAIALESTGSGTVIEFVFSVDAGWTAALLISAFAVAALASLLPGRRAASAPPVEALADI
jgi:putative ABC transport system permease protein